jgi:hypothetical protein
MIKAISAVMLPTVIYFADADIRKQQKALSTGVIGHFLFHSYRVTFVTFNQRLHYDN